MHSSKGEERKNHKYKAREWVNGAWRYIYNEKLGGNEKREFEKARIRYQNSEVKQNVRREHYKERNKDDYEESKRLRDEFDEAIDENIDAEEQYKKAFDKYSKSLVYKTDKAKQTMTDISNTFLKKAHEKKELKKTAEQRRAREEGMAEREREKKRKAAVSFNGRNKTR